MADIGEVKLFESKDIDELETAVNDYIADETTEVVDSIEYSTAIDVVQTKVVRNYTAMVIVQEPTNG